MRRDGADWRLGTPQDVAWIAASTSLGTTITAAIPAVFDAYATIVLPADDDARERQEQAVLSVLRAHSPDPWWLGYLDTGADDVVFPDAPRVTLYSDWGYVLVAAGAEQAGTWRRRDRTSFWAGILPNLMFPADHGWLVSTLWDDDWTCVGGPTALVDALVRHPELRPRSRRVLLGDEAAPPGQHAD